MDYNLLHPINGKTIIVFLIVLLCHTSILFSQNILSQKHLAEVKELLILIDNVDAKLQKVWNIENDYGVSTEKDKTYFENVQNLSRQIADRIQKLPQGDYLAYLAYSIIGYLDVGKMRLLTSVDGGQDQQIEIATKYKIQDTEPHLWAYTIWQTARELRNLVATELKLPLNNYTNN